MYEVSDAETWDVCDGWRECAGEPKFEALDGRRSQLRALALSLSDPRLGRLGVLLEVYLAMSGGRL